MKTIHYFFISFFLFVNLSGCKQAEEKQKKTEKTSQKPAETGTAFMVNELFKINANGDPMNYYNWNSKKAAIYETRYKNAGPNEQRDATYYYAAELLFAGENEKSIEVLEGYLQQFNQPYNQLVSLENYFMFELLALGYIRLGEAENCQLSHNAYSCILPLESPGQHTLKRGSEKGIEIYQLLQDFYPLDRNKWMINLAYMTLGQYPNKVPAKYRLTYPNWSKEEKNFPRFNEVAMNVGLAMDGSFGGTSIDDFNNDGFLDVFATAGGMHEQCRLFINDGNGNYKDATVEAGLTGILGGVNTVHADYNNDGFIDIFIVRGGWYGELGYQPNSLLKNNGDGTFEDVTKSSKLLSYHPTHSAAWADFNNDGWLDLFIGNESEVKSHPCEFYQNMGDGTFKEVSQDVGLGNISKFVKGCVWGDINNDGWPDLYISTVRGENLLFKNNAGKFENISVSAGVNEPLNSFLTWFFDVNNDGYEDLFVCGYDLKDLYDIAGDFAKELEGNPVTTEKPRLFINNGDETFTDKSVEYGVSKTMYGMGGNFGDLDNDGFLDFYVGTGTPEFNSIVPNRMFKNVGGKKFVEVTSAGGFGHIQKGHGVGFADLDKDGDQDIYAVMGGAYEGDNFTNVLFENPGFGNNWIVIELEGEKSNKSAIGARIELTIGKKKIVRVVSTGGSYGAASLQCEIGLGKATQITALSISWPSGESSVFNDVSGNQKIKIIEGAADVQQIDYNYVPFSTEGKHVHHH